MVGFAGNRVFLFIFFSFVGSADKLSAAAARGVHERGFVIFKTSGELKTAKNVFILYVRALSVTTISLCDRLSADRQ